MYPQSYSDNDQCETRRSHGQTEKAVRIRRQVIRYYQEPFWVRNRYDRHEKPSDEEQRPNYYDEIAEGLVVPRFLGFLMKVLTKEQALSQHAQMQPVLNSLMNFKYTLKGESLFQEDTFDANVHELGRLARLAGKPVLTFESWSNIVREQSCVSARKPCALVVLSFLKEKRDATCVVS